MLTAESIEISAPPAGTRAQMIVPEDQAYSGDQVVGFEAADNDYIEDVVFILPVADGSPGQVLSTNGNKQLQWINNGGGSTSGGYEIDGGDSISLTFTGEIDGGTSI
jgi:hypothetical protein